MANTIIEAPISYVLLAALVIIFIIIRYIYACVIRHKEARSKQFQEYAAKIKNADKEQIKACLGHGEIFEYRTSGYNEPKCPKCNYLISWERGKLLTEYGFPWHWWFFRCQRECCKYPWIMIGHDDSLDEVKDSVNQQMACVEDIKVFYPWNIPKSVVRSVDNCATANNGCCIAAEFHSDKNPRNDTFTFEYAEQAEQFINHLRKLKIHYERSSRCIGP